MQTKQTNMFYKAWIWIRSEKLLTFLTIFLILVVGFYSWLIISSENIRRAEIKTINSWASLHTMRVDNCADISGFRECSLSNSQNVVLIVRVADQNPQRVYSVLRSETLE